ncbi:biofilm peroxide resistance protein BsmA [Pectobacterium sp. B1J-3]|uniref:biofilm peroxide resistance protein BsmA n=1 Tax=Pectobacterium sp. B1J-3 TaxID=3385371 RepID=UPI00390660F8
MNIRRFLLLPLLMAVLSACTQLQGQPASPPQSTDRAQEITYAQTHTLEKMGTISAHVRGSPDDAERTIRQKADASHAPYYVITLKTEQMLPGMWYIRAVLYR